MITLVNRELGIAGYNNMETQHTRINSQPGRTGYVVGIAPLFI